MESKREFYPMITNTMKVLLNLIDDDDILKLFTYYLTSYPNHDTKLHKDNPVIISALAELDRQYARWKKGDK